MTIFGGEHMVKEIQGAGFLVYQYYSIQQDEIFVLARVDNDILTQFADTIDYRMLLDVLFVLNPSRAMASLKFSSVSLSYRKLLMSTTRSRAVLSLSHEFHLAHSPLLVAWRGSDVVAVTSTSPPRLDKGKCIGS
jgi:hypothetical protein